MPRAVHAIAGLGRSQGGPSYTVPRLCAELQSTGWETDIVAVRDPEDPPAANEHLYLARQDWTGAPILRGLRLSSEMRRSLNTLAGHASIVHAHGLWLMPNIYAGNVARALRRPLIVSPRGMLSPEALAFSRVKKRFFWSLLQEAAYRSAFAWHATSDAEAADLRAFGVRAPIAVIPNGVDIPIADRGFREDLNRKSRAPDAPRRLLFLSRLHPKKGIPNLLQAWSAVAGAHPHWTLRLVGPDENGHEAELKSLVSQNSVPRVEFAGPVYGEAKWSEYRAADVFILPTRNENFGVSVAEALGMGIPAIVTHGAPWKGLIDHKCGWWVEGSAPALQGAISDALTLTDAAREAMGENGRAWAERDFGWRRIAEDMSKVYHWAIAKDDLPGFVRLD